MAAKQRKTYNQYCGLAQALDRVGDRWTILLLRELMEGEKRFVQLKAALPGIASNLLAERLRWLQDDGLIEQVTLPLPALANAYVITAFGRELEEAFRALMRWGSAWMMGERPATKQDVRWLRATIGALLDGTVGRRDTVRCAMHVDAQLITISFSAEGVVVDSENIPTDLTLGCSAPIAIALVRGDLSLSRAVADRSAFVYGPDDAIERFKRALSITRIV